MSTITNDLVSHLMCGEAIALNDAVYIKSADGKIYKYNPLDPTQVYAGIAKEAGLLNAFIRVVQSGRVKGFTGLTPGAFVYASVTTPGGFQLTDPGVTSKVVLGIAKSATELTVNGALGIKTGGDGTGSGSLDTILQLTATEQLTDWSTGNNATVLGGGVLAGSFVKETSTPLHGAESYKYTQAAGSLNDYFLSKSFPVDVRFRGQQVYFSAPIQYNGNTGDIQIVIYDVTNATVLTTLSNSIIGTNGATQTVIASALLPLTCVNIRAGFQVKVLNSGKVFSFDDIQVGTSVSSLGNISGIITEDARYFGAGLLTTTGTIRFSNATFSRQFSKLLSYDQSNGRFTALTNVTVSGGFTLDIASSAAVFDVNINGVGVIRSNTTPASANYKATAPFSVKMSAGDYLTVTTTATLTNSSNDLIVITATASSDSIVTPTQQISSDTLPFTFKATAIVDADPIGTFNTYTYAANANTATISASAPTQTVASMNADGFRIFARPVSSTSTTASPARVDIKIGKGLKAEQVNSYASAAKVDPLAIDFMGLSNVELGTHVSYDEQSGILRITAGVGFSNTTTRYVGLSTSSSTNQTSGYFVFNASTSPSITALPILQPRIAYLKDTKTGAVGGGASSAGVYQTRTLNTLVDSTGIVTSLSANIFLLQAGTYSIEACAPCFVGGSHKLRLRNTTDSTTAILGQKAYTATTDLIQTNAYLSGEFTITTAKSFSIEHFITTANGEGLGVSNASGGDDTTFTEVRLQKVR